MKVLVVSEESHSLIFIADNLEAVKCELLRSNWVNGHCLCWNKAKGEYWDFLKEVYGENWEKHYMDFNKEDLENMGFYIREMEVVRE